MQSVEKLCRMILTHEDAEQGHTERTTSLPGRVQHSPGEPRASLWCVQKYGCNQLRAGQANTTANEEEKTLGQEKATFCSGKQKPQRTDTTEQQSAHDGYARAGVRGKATEQRGCGRG